jgi:hypothetical protein
LQFNQKILERNKELSKLKTTAGRTVQELDRTKRDLAVMIKESRDVQVVFAFESALNYFVDSLLWAENYFCCGLNMHLLFMHSFLFASSK